MALIFMDGFDHYTQNQISDKWDAVGAGPNLSSAYARFSGQGYQSYGTGYWLKKIIPSNETTLYVGFAWYRDAGGTLNGGNWGILKFMDENAVIQVSLRLDAGLGFTALLGDGTELGSSAADVISNYRWHYIEAKVTISATVGVVEVKIDGTQVLNLTSQDTKYGSDYIRQVYFGGCTPNQYSWFDDFYVDDAQFNGDCRIRTFMPDSISSTNNSFTASAGNKDDCVDESPSNEDTDYITSDTLNHKQGFGITTGTLGTVVGIQLNNHCRLDEAGTRKITPLIRSNSTDYSGTETDAIAANYNFEYEIWETDPDDSNPWTQTKLEAAEFGLEITT